MAKAKRRRPMAEINVVPYIDVMLVLLVIFIVATPLMTQGIVVDLPKAASGTLDAPENEPTLVVSIKADGSYYINVGEDEKAVSLRLIEERSRKIISASPTIKVLVEANQHLSYGTVINLMNVLQTAGAKSVGLITEPPEE